MGDENAPGRGIGFPAHRAVFPADVRNPIRGDADAPVPAAHQDVVPLFFGGQADLAALGAVFDGVSQKIGKDLVEADRIGRCIERRLGFGHRYPAAPGRIDLFQGPDGVPRTPADVHGRFIERDLAPGDPGDVQQIVHQPPEQFDLPLDDLVRPVTGRLFPFSPGGFQGRPDGRQGVSQFMAQHGQEFVLAPGGGFEFRFDPLPVGDVRAGADHAQESSFVG